MKETTTVDGLIEEPNVEEGIAYWISRYRELKREADILKLEMDGIKDLLEPVIVEHGDWKDASGYARLTSRSASVTYSGKEVDNLVEAWISSEDPIMQSCGKMLQAYRKVSEAKSYLTVK